MISIPSTIRVTPDRLWAVHALVVAAVTAYLCIAAVEAEFSGLAVFLCCLAVAALVLVPRFPVIALGVFVLAAYGLPRYGPEFTALLKLNLLNWLSCLSLIGWICWLARERVQPRLGDWLTLAMCGFTLWVGIAILAAWARGEALDYFPRHHPAQYFQGMVFFLLAAHTLGERNSAWWFSLLLCILPTLQAQQLGNARIYLDSDLPAVSAMIFPVAALGAVFAPYRVMQLAFGVLALDMLRIVALAHNRAAAVGLACAVAALWWNSRYRMRWALVAGPLLLVAGWLLVPQGYLDRFRVLWDSQASHQTAELDRATIRGRLELWDAGSRMVSDHPLLGVGPGNYPHAVKRYLSWRTDLPTHSNALNVAAEMGIPGLLLYLALFLVGIIALQRVTRRARPQWPEPGARMVQAALVAYMGFGFFISRQDMQLAYLLLGWAAALQLQRIHPASQGPLRRDRTRRVAT